MHTYSFVVINDTGQRKTGSIKAASRDDAIDKLKENDFIITRIFRKEEEDEKASVAQKKINIFANVVRDEDLMVFTRELATMIGAGLPLVESLYVLAEDTKSKKLSSVVQNVGKNLISGKSFSDSLALHPDVFNKMYINLVKVGEMSGSLEKILNRLADYLESNNALKKKVQSAMYYPAVVMSFAILIVTGLFIYIIPQFQEIYSSFGGALPTATKVFLDFAGFFAQWYWAIFIGFALLIYGFVKFIKTPTGRKMFDSLKLSVPGIGAIVQEIVISRFSKTLSLLYSSGIPIVDSMNMVANSCGNVIFEKAILDASDKVLEGSHIAGPLERSKMFPIMVVNMIDVGERTGNFSEMLNKIAEFYDNSVNSAIAGLTSILEPILVVFMGIFIGTMAVALFLPIVNLPALIMR